MCICLAVFSLQYCADLSRKIKSALLQLTNLKSLFLVNFKASGSKRPFARKTFQQNLL